MSLQKPSCGCPQAHTPKNTVAQAAQICAEKSLKLTPQRRKVLETLAESPRPLGAYELADRLVENGQRPAPISIYRALDFLQEAGLIHRIESRNAFAVCAGHHAKEGAMIFLLCESCGTAVETSSEEIARSLKKSSQQVGFTPRTTVIEIPGTCGACRKLEQTATA